MKKLLTLALAALFTAQSFAATDTKFVALDQTLETNLCVIAAKQGYQAAKDTAAQFENFNKSQFKATVCNGVNIQHFASQFEKAKQEVVATEVEQVVYRFKPVDDTYASRFCAIAAKQGLQQAISLGGRQVKGLICNGKTISSFARKYQNS